MKPRKGPVQPGNLPVTGASRASATARETGKPSKRPLLQRKFGLPNTKDWYFFSLELRTALRAGFPMIQALDLMMETSARERVRKAAHKMREALSTGIGLEAYLSKGKKPDIPEIMIAFMLVGQQSGSMIRMLDYLIAHYEWLSEVRRKILSAAIYPIALIILGTLVMVARDAVIASLTGGNVTAVLIRAGIGLIMPLIYAVVVAWILAKGSRVWSIRPHVDAFLVTVPLLGTVLHKYSVAVFMQTFATLIEAGSPVDRAYITAANACPNKAITRKLLRWEYFLKDGESITSTLEKTRVFKREVISMAAAGERTATTPFLIKKLAEYYNEDIRNLTHIMVRAINPFLIVVVAGGFFVNPLFLAWLMFFLMIFIFAV